MTIEIDCNINVRDSLYKQGLHVSSLQGRVLLHDYSKFSAPITCYAALAPDNWIEIDSFTGVYGGRIGFAKIGRYCSIADGVDIGADQHPVHWLTSSMVGYVRGLHDWDKFAHPDKFEDIRKNTLPYFDSNTQVVIGNDVWVGQGVFIKSGVRIGNGAIVAAHAVVVKDIPDYAIVAGVPARVIKYRFDEKIIERLLALKWWDYSVYDFDGVDFSNIEIAMENIQLQIEDKKIVPYCPKVWTPLDIKALVTG